MSEITAIIVAAGSSRRMGFNKLLADLDGTSVIRRSVMAFATHHRITRVLVVTSSREIEEEIQDLAEVVPGGDERYHSVWNGLQAAGECALVAVHDGARPLIDAESISACLHEAAARSAAACARRIADTVKRADGENRVTEAIDRANLWAMETPQCFRTELLRKAYRTVLDQSLPVTDEVSAVEAIGEPVYLVENPRPNLKITWPGDLETAARLLP